MGGDSMKSILAEKASGNLKQFFGNKTFIELSTQAAKNLIIHLYKCYIRKHFKKKSYNSFFFLLKKYHLDQSLCTKNCTQKILRHQFESKKKIMKARKKAYHLN